MRLTSTENEGETAKVVFRTASFGKRRLVVADSKCKTKPFSARQRECCKSHANKWCPSQPPSAQCTHRISSAHIQLQQASHREMATLTLQVPVARMAARMTTPDNRPS